LYFARFASFSRIALGLVSAIFAGQVLALNLGNLSIQSKVGEPLDAQISIQIDPAELSSIKDIQASLASPEMYQRLGITSSAAQAQLKITVLKGSKEEPTAIRISSDEVLKLAANEIFLDALIELRWSVGLVRRVYTLMVADQARVEVKAGETLTEIASKLVANFDEANLDQALISLYRANPQAFAGGSIHRLLAGAELKMPSQAMIQSVPKEEAKEIIQSADTAYRSGKGNLPLSALPASKDKEPPVVVGDRLKVGPAAGLEGEANRRMEELLVQEKALSEAKQRIVELEKNIADLKKLIQNQTSSQAKAEGIDWKNQTGPLAIVIFVFLAILVLLKLSKGEANKVRQSASSVSKPSSGNFPQAPNAVPEQAAKLFASLDLNLGPAASSTKAATYQTGGADLPNAESLRVKLNLIRAYITIEDFAAAREAIQQVLAVSNQIDPELTIQAKSLMAEVNQLSSK
jgi:pilus assembly protein FimV